MEETRVKSKYEELYLKLYNNGPASLSSQDLITISKALAAYEKSPNSTGFTPKWNPAASEHHDKIGLTAAEYDKVASFLDASILSRSITIADCKDSVGAAERYHNLLSVMTKEDGDKLIAFSFWSLVAHHIHLHRQIKISDELDAALEDLRNKLSTREKLDNLKHIKIQELEKEIRFLKIKSKV